MENYDTENLARVLERICNPPENHRQSQDNSGRLREFIRQEAASAAMYTLLAIKTKGGPAEAVFKRAAQDERRHEKLLQTEYFLLRGDTCPAAKEQPSAPYLLEAVRRQYIDELNSAAVYEEAAKASPEGRAAAMYKELARDERRHAAAMRALVERLID